MRTIMIFSFLCLLPQAHATPTGPGREINVLTDDNHCNLDFLEQQRQANRDLLQKAEQECGRSLVPVQTSETIMKENLSCIHYRLGVRAQATFRCEALEPEL